MVELITENDILNNLIESGMINSTTIQNVKEEMRRKEIIEKHDKKIWLSDDGYWKTYIIENGKRKLIKKKQAKDLYDCLEEKQTRETTFKIRYDAWVERQKLCGLSNNSVNKYKSDYKRFYEGYPFENIAIIDITETTIFAHYKQVLQDKKIPYRALREAFGNVKQIFIKSIRDRIIEKDKDPCEFVDLKMLKPFCTDTSKKIENRTFTDDEIDLLKERIKNPINYNPNHVSNLSLEFAIYTGMRVGEISGLRWEDIKYDKGYINICHSEKYDRETHERYIADTKNFKIRRFPLTDKIISLLDKVKEYEQDNGYFGEFVFMDKRGRLTTGQISSAAYNKTGKSIHALRRTLNSKLKCSGVATPIAASMLGHTEIVNDSNYTNDVTTINYKKELLDKIQ